MFDFWDDDYESEWCEDMGPQPELADSVKKIMKEMRRKKVFD